MVKTKETVHLWNFNIINLTDKKLTLNNILDREKFKALPLRS